MKNIIINSFIVLFTLTSLAQTIEPLETKWSTNFLASNTYFKDVNDELDKFIGTWKYEDAVTNTIFEITFYKEENIDGLRNCTFDKLNANFKLSINGAEQYNTYINNYGKMIITGGFYVERQYLSDGSTIENPPSINRYHLNIVEPDFLELLGSSDLTVVYENDSGTEKLNWNNVISKAYDYVTNQQVNIYKMPLEMMLIKQ